MRQLWVICCLLLTSSLFAQPLDELYIYKLSDVKEIEINVPVKFFINMYPQLPEQLSVEEEYRNFLSIDMSHGRLYINGEGEDIPAQEITIEIQAPDLRFVQLTQPGRVSIINVNRNVFSVMALTGTIDVAGEVRTLIANGEVGTVDARKLQMHTAQLNFWDKGAVYLSSPQEVKGKIGKATTLTYQNTPEISLKHYSSPNEYYEAQKKITPEPNPHARFIAFSLKNNSARRIQCYVRGPKPDGRSFGYGFPMNPGQKRKKDWSIGSKVYQVSKLGTRKLLVTIEAEDEGQVVKMFE